MNDKIRAEIENLLQQKGITKAELARLTGKTPQEISRALKDPFRSPKMPDVWQKIFDVLQVQLTLETTVSPEGDKT